MMKLWFTRCRSALALAMLLAAGMTLSSIPVHADDDDGPRQPPPTRSSDVLSDRVFRIISRVQEMMNPEDDSEPQWERAKSELDGLNERYDSLNDFEKATLLNFYTNYYLAQDMVQEALTAFERMLTIEDLRVAQRTRALMALGQIYAGEERYAESIEALEEWRRWSEEERPNVFLLLANSHYNLDNYDEAIPYLLRHIEMLQAEEREIRRNIYSLLNLMYIEQERYDMARDVTETMIALYDEPADWRNLAAIYGYLDDNEARLQVMELAYQQDYMASEAEFMNLAQSLAGMDAPWRGIQVLEEGMRRGIVEEDRDNMRRLTQMYMMASEFQNAIGPASRAADLAEDGEAYDYLGYIYYMNREYEDAVDALRRALELGLDDASDAHMFLARSLVELDRFDEAEESARRARELGSSGAESYITYIQNSRQRHETLQRRREEAADFFQS